MPKILEDAHTQLAAVASDGLGVSGRIIWNPMLDGEKIAESWPSLAEGVFGKRSLRCNSHGRAG
jgi:hypothetical protein